jgi:hypothetical protein
LVLIIFPACEPREAYPEIIVDVNLSSDDETMPAGDDTRDERATSAEPTTPGPIITNVPEKSKPSATDQVIAVSPSGRQG